MNWNKQERVTHTQIKFHSRSSPFLNFKPTLIPVLTLLNFSSKRNHSFFLESLGTGEFTRRMLPIHLSSEKDPIDHEYQILSCELGRGKQLLS